MFKQKEKEIDVLRNKVKKATFYRDTDCITHIIVSREDAWFEFKNLHTYEMDTIYYDEVAVDAKFYILKEI
jgi:hypothetical protein